MPNCEVVGVANRWPDRKREWYYNHEAWMESLRKFDAAPSVLGLGEDWGGLVTIARRMRQWLREGKCRAKFLIFSNCFDVLFLAHPDEVAERWGGGDDVMFNTEKDFFPPGVGLANRFPDTGSPWRYLNSGLYIGKPQSILNMLEAMWLDEICDDHRSPDELHGGAGRQINVVEQNWFQLQFAAQVVPITLDTECKCFQTFSSCTWDEFDLAGPMVKNKVTGTTPLVLHCNGGAKNEMLPDLCRKFGFTP